MARSSQSTRTAVDSSVKNGNLDETDERDSASFDLVSYLPDHPEVVWNDLNDQISILVEAVIDARVRLECLDGATRREVVLDLYDEEVITKRDAVEQGPFEVDEFFEALLARRRARQLSAS